MDIVAFQIGNFTIYWYGILSAAGFLVALWTASKRGWREGLAPTVLMDLGPWLIVGGVIGARALYVISYWKEFFADKPLWEIFMLRHGGLVYYGGLMGAAAATILFVRRRRLALWKVADVLAPSIALGHAFGRIGCLMNGCCYGRVTSLPWAIHFPSSHETYPAGVHPTQLYESLLNLGLCAALAWLHPRKKFDGQVFAFYLVGYALLRAFVEAFRGDYRAFYWSGILTSAQLVSLATLAAGFMLLWKLPVAKPKTK